jgi:hypothetical protein
LIVIVILLVFGKRIRRSILMDSTHPYRGTCVINIIARIASVYTPRKVHSMSATSCHGSEATAHCVIMLSSWILIILRRRG